MTLLHRFEPAKSGILLPGSLKLETGTERYPVNANGMIVIDLKPGDLLEVIDPQGRQPCEIVLFDSKGSCKPDALTIHGAAVIDSNIPTLLQLPNEGSLKIVAGLKKRSINFERMKSLRIMEGDTPAEHMISATAEEPLTCIIAAPGNDMSSHEQCAPTELIVYIVRSNPEANPEPKLPEPLADPVLDERVNRCTARAFEVKAGDYIQIIDVEGKECSDFQCFDAQKLQAGVERCLDATTTRTLMAHAYPLPGLHSKFYDQDMSAMVEVIRDTCGRHDSFGLACTAKYYDDAGYPGHVNCSDNFNAALSPYSIQPRMGWMAMNNFFNTAFDDHNQLLTEEPWSRPGDYVLMRALKDLVCVASACPDDIDPANGWNPTDIHVRVYPGKHKFSTAVAITPSLQAQYSSIGP